MPCVQYMHGLTGPNDPFFKATFTDVYNGTGLADVSVMLWFACAG